MKVIVAITGASGAIYARLLLERLLACRDVEHIWLVSSRTGIETAAFEGQTMPSDSRIEVLDNNDMFAAIASGSVRCEAMIVVPCSVGTLARIAHGISQTLIERAADVMLKERRKLVLVVRETPYSLIHLRNMLSVTEAGGVIVAAAPSFYSRPATIEQAVMTVVERALQQAGVQTEHFEWSKPQTL